MNKISPTDQYGIGKTVEEIMGLWEELSISLEKESFQKIFREEQEQNQKNCQEFRESIIKHIKKFPKLPYRRKSWKKRLEKLILEWMEKDIMLQLGELPSDIRNELSQAVRKFIRDARDFDQALEPEALIQALRNYFVYVMLCLACDEKNWFHHGIWAYSLLYPYTDNFLDGEKSLEEKLQFNCKLEKRLKGEGVLAEKELEEKIFSMVAAIEKVYPRENFETVYDYLLIIQDAQVKSLQQYKHSPKTERELLRISVYKGGASIYADQALINGNVKPADIPFLTAFGCFLQLADDLQDLEEDRESGHQTYMTLKAGKGKLDQPAEQLLKFLLYIFQNYWTGVAEIRTFMLDNCVQLILMTVFQKQEYFTAEFINRISEWSVLPVQYCANMETENKKMQEEFQSWDIDFMEILDC